jgi:hypothetical protein
MKHKDISRIDLIKEIGKEFPKGKGVEVGTFRGEFSKEIMENWEGSLYMVDVWRPLSNEEYLDASNHGNHENQIYGEAMNNIKGFEDRAVMVRASSEIASDMFEDNSLDFVYIDANHAYDYVVQDIELWYPKIKEGGYLCGHDYINMDWYNDPNFTENGKDKHIYSNNFYHGVFGVNPAVDEFCEKNGYDSQVTKEWFGTWSLKKSQSKNTKKLIIISTYPENQQKEDILSKCIDKLKSLEFDILIVSHHPIPLHIQNKVDYCLIDNQNTLLPYELTPRYWCVTNDFNVIINNYGHQLTVSTNIQNGIDFATNNNYEFFLFTESDNLIDELDIKKIDELSLLMSSTNKKMVFFNHLVENNPIYETLIFGGVPSYYQENIKLPLKVVDVLNNPKFSGLSLERILYEQANKKDDYLLIETDSKSYFNNSSLNRITHDYNVEIIGSNSNDNLVLWINNSTNDKNITFIIGDEPELILGPKNWHYCFKQIGETVNVTIDDNGVLSHKTFTITDEEKIKYIEKGMITFNKLN